MPRYRCHKIVSAAKILDINACGPCLEFDHGAVPVNIGPTGLSVGFDQDPADVVIHWKKWRDKHNPEVGGYLVVDEDGYTSYSPSKAFEEGYTRIRDNATEVLFERWLQEQGYRQGRS